MSHRLACRKCRRKYRLESGVDFSRMNCPHCGGGLIRAALATADSEVKPTAPKADDDDLVAAVVIDEQRLAEPEHTDDDDDDEYQLSPLDDAPSAPPPGQPTTPPSMPPATGASTPPMAGPTPRGSPCPECGSLIEKFDIVCLECGYDTRSGRNISDDSLLLSQQRRGLRTGRRGAHNAAALAKLALGYDLVLWGWTLQGVVTFSIALLFMAALFSLGSPAIMVILLFLGAGGLLWLAAMADVPPLVMAVAGVGMFIVAGGALANAGQATGIAFLTLLAAMVASLVGRCFCLFTPRGSAALPVIVIIVAIEAIAVVFTLMNLVSPFAPAMQMGVHLVSLASPILFLAFTYLVGRYIDQPSISDDALSSMITSAALVVGAGMLFFFARISVLFFALIALAWLVGFAWWFFCYLRLLIHTRDALAYARGQR